MTISWVEGWKHDVLEFEKKKALGKAESSTKRIHLSLLTDVYCKSEC